MCCHCMYYNIICMHDCIRRTNFRLDVLLVYIAMLTIIIVTVTYTAMFTLGVVSGSTIMVHFSSLVAGVL